MKLKVKEPKAEQTEMAVMLIMVSRSFYRKREISATIEQGQWILRKLGSSRQWLIGDRRVRETTSAELGQWLDSFTTIREIFNREQNHRFDYNVIR